MDNRKAKAFTLFEIIIVITIAILLASISGLAVKTFIDSNKAICSTVAIEAIINLSKATAMKEGNYAGVYFYDQNDSLCAMDIIAAYDYSVPYILLKRLDGRQIKEIGSPGDVNKAVVLFSANGRLVSKDVMIGTYRNISSRSLNINDKDYYINSYTGRLINPP